MSSKQLAANRRNAQKSTGPRSVEGKARASQNALKSGLYAESVVIGPERAADLDALTADFYDEHQPSTPTECSLVDQLVHGEWMLRRLRRVEQEVWKWEESHLNDHCRSISAEGRIYTGDKQLTFDRIHRQRLAISRTQRQTLAELRRLRASRTEPQSVQSGPEPVPEPVAAEATYPENGFVPSDLRSAPEFPRSGRQNEPLTGAPCVPPQTEI